MSTILTSRINLLFVFIFAAFLVGCSLPATTPTNAPPGVVTPDAVYTAAVQTAVAVLTQGAQATVEPELSEATESVAAPSPEPTQEPTQASTSTSEPAPSATPQPSPTTAPAASPTASASDPRTTLGNPTFTDPFDDDDNWAFTDDEHTAMEVNDGRLELVAFNADFWEGWTITWVSGSDFYVEMTAAPQNCSGADRYGIFFRAENDASEGYLFGFTCDGKYSLRVWDEEEFIEIIDWTTSAHINAGAGSTNRLGVLTDSDSIKLYANGNLLQEVHDDSYEEGHIGVFVGSGNTEDFTVYVDQIDWWDLE